MEKQRWEESETRRAEERRSEKRKSQKKEDAGARKGRKVAKTMCFSRFGEMILRDRCSTSYDLASSFHGRRGTLDRWS